MKELQAACSLEGSIEKVVGDFFGDGFQTFHDHAFAWCFVPADENFIFRQEENVDFSSNTFFKEGEVQLQDGGSVFICSEFSGGCNQIAFLVEGKPGFFEFSKSGRDAVPFAGFQKVYGEIAFFTGE